MSRPDLLRLLGCILERFFLLRGTVQERLAVLALWAILCIYFAVFWNFFGIAPGSASAMQDRMERSFFWLFLLPFDALAVFAWLAALIGALYGAMRDRTLALSMILSLCLAPAAFLILSRIYDAFLRGHGTVVHQWLYQL